MKTLNRIKTLRNPLKPLLVLCGVMWRYLFYPIRYLLRHRVERYKVELEQIRWRQQHLKPKARRLGMTETFFSFMIRDMFLSIKYERFIKKWSL
jgi:hypothetical protein